MKHIEVAGCIVNIREGLKDTEGRPVTSIEILCDKYSGGDSWSLPDFDYARAIYIRVVRDTKVKI